MKKLLLNSLAAVCLTASATPAFADNHDFQGSYIMSNFYMDYVNEDYTMDELPLVIGEDNVINNFANFTPFNKIKGVVEDNEFTFTCDDEFMILDIDFDTMHYIILNGDAAGAEEFEKTPITITYNPETEEYQMSSWTIWDYDPMEKTFVQLGYCMMFGLYPGEIQEDVDFTGTYLVKGTKTVYTDGVASESEDEFIMTLQPDGTGLYEFTEFAGYEVGEVPSGWLGVFAAVYGLDLEIQGADIEKDAEGNGLKLGTPFDEFDDKYIVTVFFEDTESGSISNFGVWEMVEGEPVELLVKWSNLTFTRDNEGSGIETPAIEEATPAQPPVYYDLNGRIVKNPSAGIYIVKQGDKTRKAVIR